MLNTGGFAFVVGIDPAGVKFGFYETSRVYLYFKCEIAISRRYTDIQPGSDKHSGYFVC